MVPLLLTKDVASPLIRARKPTAAVTAMLNARMLDPTSAHVSASVIMLGMALFAPRLTTAQRLLMVDVIIMLSAFLHRVPML